LAIEDAGLFPAGQAVTDEFHAISFDVGRKV
jgi:hypothetical protein